MGTDTKGTEKKMAKTIATTGDEGFVAGVKSWPEKVKSFYHDVRTEMRKVTTPSRKEVQATTMVVMITVVVFGAYFWAVDLVIGRAIRELYKYFGAHL